MQKKDPGQSLREFLAEAVSRKQAEAKSEAALAEKTDHPIKSEDDNLQAASEGARSAENTKDVKEMVGGNSVDASSASDGIDESKVTPNIGLRTYDSEEAPSDVVSTDKTHPDPGTSHPAKTDGKKEASLSDLIKTASALGKTLCAALINEPAGQAAPAATKAAGASPPATSKAAAAGEGLADMVLANDVPALHEQINHEIYAIVKEAALAADLVNDALDRVQASRRKAAEAASANPSQPPRKPVKRAEGGDPIPSGGSEGPDGDGDADDDQPGSEPAGEPGGDAPPIVGGADPMAAAGGAGGGDPLANIDPQTAHALLQLLMQLESQGGAGGAEGGMPPGAGAPPADPAAGGMPPGPEAGADPAAGGSPEDAAMLQQMLGEQGVDPAQMKAACVKAINKANHAQKTARRQKIRGWISEVVGKSR